MLPIYAVLILINIINTFVSTKTIEKDFQFCLNTGKHFQLSNYKEAEVINFLNIIARFSDTFNVVYFADSSPAVIYSNDGLLFETKCEEVSQIDLATETDKCTRDLLAQFKVQDTDKIGFLTKTGF